MDATKKEVALGLNLAGEASFTYNLEKLHSAAISIRQTVRSVLGVGINTLECYRNGALKFSGIIISADYNVDEITGIVNVKAVGWLWLLGQRFVGLNTDLVYTETDLGAIAWGVVNTTQQNLYGDLGITQGIIETSVNRTVTYTRKSVKDVLEELVQSGIEFDITPAKILNIYYPQKGSDKSDTVKFLYPGNDFISIEELTDGAEINNFMFAMGYGLGSEELTYTGEDSSSQSVFKRREELLPLKDVQNVTVLADITDQNIDDNKNLHSIYKLKVVGNNSPVDSIAVGDYVGVKVKTDYYEINRALRVFEIHFSVDEKDLETINFVLGLV